MAVHIVIADQAPGVAEDIKRSLNDRGYADVRVAKDLHAPELQAADILVAGVDGPDLWRQELSRLRIDRPAMARLLLAHVGSSQDPAVVSWHDGAHRVLPKPVDVDALVDAIESIRDLRTRLGRPDLRRYVGGVDHLPAAPQTFFRLLQMVGDENVSFTRIAAAIESEPALVVQVLRLCNSAYFGASREITDIRMAISRLGMTNVRNILLASEVFELGRALLPEAELRNIQDRAFRISRIAGMLLTPSSYDMVTTAGLLTEVGRLVPPPSTFDGEAPDYVEAGAYLLGLWGLPMPIVEAVAYHRTPGRARAPKGFWLSGALHVAAGLVNDDPLDEGYLAEVGVLERVPDWRRTAERYGLIPAPL